MSRPAKTKPEPAWSVRWRRVACAATLWIAIVQGGSAFAQNRTDVGKGRAAVPPHCHVLNMMERDISEALKRCGDISRLFKPELFHSQRMGSLFATGLQANEILTLFGQGRFGARFSLGINGPYIAPNMGAEGASAEIKQPALGKAVRGGLIEDSTDDLGQPTVKGGQVIWSAAPSTLDGDGRIARVVGALAISGSKIKLDVSLMPAEAGKGLTMIVKLSGESGAECGIPRIRRTGDRSGEPLDMVGRDPIEGEFLFVPSADTRAVPNIVSALFRGQWLDVPVRLNGGGSYTLTLELARPGYELLSRAFEDWNLVPRRP